MNDSGIDTSPQIAFNSFNASQISPPVDSVNDQLTLKVNYETVEQKTQLATEPPHNDISQDADETSSECDDDEDVTTDEAVSSKSRKSTVNDSDASKPPKPYLEIIADAILSVNVRMMQLHEIYNFMENKYQYFAKNVNKSWRNSVRHNLSLNECFVKAGRGSNGKGNYWRIHPLCEKEFIRGNFRRKSFKKLIKAGSMPMSAQNGMYQMGYSNLAAYRTQQHMFGVVNPMAFQYPLYAQQTQNFNVQNSEDSF